jgi:hypothetical protein
MKKKFVIFLGAAFLGIASLTLASLGSPFTLIATDAPATNSVTVTSADYVAADHAFEKDGMSMPVQSYEDSSGTKKIDCSGTNIVLTLTNYYSPYINSPLSDLTGNKNGRRGNGQYSAALSGVSDNQGGNVNVYLVVGTDTTIPYNEHYRQNYVSNGPNFTFDCLKDCYGQSTGEPAARVRSRFHFYYGVSGGVTVTLSSITFTWQCTAA